MANIRYITIHCSASPQGRGDNAETFHKWHLERGWSGIGYHYVILENGTVERGRPHYWTGSHVGGHNTGNLGICFVGEDSFTDAQYGALTALLRELVNKYPNAKILGHRDWPDVHKTCPNFEVSEYLNRVGLGSRFKG